MSWTYESRTVALKVEKKEGEECAEIGNMTRSGQCFKPDHLRTTEGPRKIESSRERPSNRGLSQGSQETRVECGGTTEKDPRADLNC